MQRNAVCLKENIPLSNAFSQGMGDLESPYTIALQLVVVEDPS